MNDAERHRHPLTPLGVRGGEGVGLIALGIEQRETALRQLADHDHDRRSVEKFGAGGANAQTDRPGPGRDACGLFQLRQDRVEVAGQMVGDIDEADIVDALTDLGQTGADRRAPVACRADPDAEGRRHVHGRAQQDTAHSWL